MGQSANQQKSQRDAGFFVLKRRAKFFIGSIDAVVQGGGDQPELELVSVGVVPVA
jgi:hypothetical protein